MVLSVLQNQLFLPACGHNVRANICGKHSVQLPTLVAVNISANSTAETKQHLEKLLTNPK